MIYNQLMPVEPSISLLALIELLGVVQAILFACLLFFIRRGHHQANRLLALILLFFSATLFHQFLIDSHYIYKLPALAGFTLPLEVFYGPLLFRYIQILTQPEKNRSLWQGLKHFILPALIGMMAIPFFALTFEQKLRIIEQNYASSEWIGLTQISLPIQFSAFGLMFTVYLLSCFIRLYKHNKFINSYFSFREKITLSWLRKLLITMLIFWCFMAAFLAVINSIVLTNIILLLLTIFTVIAVHYIGIMGLLQPRIFPVGKTVKKEQSESSETSSNTEAAILKDLDPTALVEQIHASDKYKHSGLDDEDLKRIAGQLESVMTSNKPYLENNLTLPTLAKMLDLSPNYLSQTLNGYFNVNFFDFINGYRIDAAKRQLSEGDPKKYIILGLALDSGFNSKSAFYTAFKKHTGLTPTQFRKEQRKHF